MEAPRWLHSIISQRHIVWSVECEECFDLCPAVGVNTACDSRHTHAPAHLPAIRFYPCGMKPRAALPGGRTCPSWKRPAFLCLVLITQAEHWLRQLMEWIRTRPAAGGMDPNHVRKADINAPGCSHVTKHTSPNTHVTKHTSPNAHIIRHT